MTLICPFTGAAAGDDGAAPAVPGPSAVRTPPPYSHELSWPEGLEPFKVVDDGSQGDPYRHYRWMLDNAPVLRAASPTSDVWFISRYDDVRKALRAPKIFSSEVVKPVPLTFLTLIDAPDHARLRQIVAKAFTPKAISLFEDRIRETAELLLGHLVAQGGCDVVEDYAIPLSMSTISGLLDVPAEDFEKMKFWSDETFSYFGRLARNAPGTGTDEQSANAFFAYLKDTMERLHAEGNESVGGHIARMWKEGELTEKEAKELCAFVFIAGQDTTTILLANAFRVVAERPELLGRLRGAPEDAEPFVEELARFRGTVQRVSRITAEAVEVAGVMLPKGAIVRLMPAAANHDAEKFPNPDVFDIDRDTSGHLGFGHGVHSCLGAPLARLETKVTAELLGRRLASVSLDPDHEIEYVRGNNLTNSGPERLVVKVEDAMSDHVVIVGSGHAGVGVAAGLRARKWGGRITLVDAEGTLPYERPPLSKELLAPGTPAAATPLRKESYYETRGIERVHGDAAAIDRDRWELVLAGGRALPYTQLVLATGSTPRRLTVPGADLAGVLMLKTLHDARRLAGELAPGRRVVVVGAGYIGLEVAAAAARLGCRVTVLEFQDRVMRRVTSEPVSRFFEDLHRRAGVDFVFGAAVTGFEGEAAAGSVRVAHVVTDDGVRHPADVVIAGIGVVPEQGLAEAAGLDVADGVLVDHAGRTSDPRIYAAGDVTRSASTYDGASQRLECLQNARAQAEAVAASIAGGTRPAAEVPWFWTVQHGVRLQTAGVRRPDDEAVVRGEPSTGRFTVLYVRDGRLAAVDTVGSLADFNAAKRLVADRAVLDLARAWDPDIPLAETVAALAPASP